MTALEQEMRWMIAQEGPLSVERFMSLALSHPKYGYYMTRDPFGARGDFITAPEISQMFGELLGLWVAEVWAMMGQPKMVRLVEIGPGRGTLMADALRALRSVPGFIQAVEVHMIETSPVLIERQKATLARAPIPVLWHKNIDEVPEGPVIILANELFDALPVRHYVRTQRGWCERLIGLDETGQMVFGASSEVEPTLATPAAIGEILEIGVEGRLLMRELARRLQRQPGAVLAIDYGHTRTALGETLQALKGHQFVDPLSNIGEADLTAHVDFAALIRAAKTMDVIVHGPISQGEFLNNLGIAERANGLKRRATETQAAEIDAALLRLIDPAPEHMGELFKVVAISSVSLPQLPAFPEPTPDTLQQDTTRQDTTRQDTTEDVPETINQADAATTQHEHP